MVRSKQTGMIIPSVFFLIRIKFHIFFRSRRGGHFFQMSVCPSRESLQIGGFPAVFFPEIPVGDGWDKIPRRRRHVFTDFRLRKNFRFPGIPFRRTEISPCNTPGNAHHQATTEPSHRLFSLFQYPAVFLGSNPL